MAVHATRDGAAARAGGVLAAGAGQDRHVIRCGKDLLDGQRARNQAKPGGGHGRAPWLAARPTSVDDLAPRYNPHAAPCLREDQDASGTDIPVASSTHTLLSSSDTSIPTWCSMAVLLMAGPEPLGSARSRHHSEETRTNRQPRCRPITASTGPPNPRRGSAPPFLPPCRDWLSGAACRQVPQGKIQPGDAGGEGPWLPALDRPACSARRQPVPGIGGVLEAAGQRDRRDYRFEQPYLVVGAERGESCITPPPSRARRPCPRPAVAARCGVGCCRTMS